MIEGEAGSSPAEPPEVKMKYTKCNICGEDRSAVDTPPKPKIGRPRTGFNKKEYNRQFTADLRALRRLGLDCTVKEYRTMKEMGNAVKYLQNLHSMLCSCAFYLPFGKSFTGW